jgi:hypothetical protein
MLISDGINGSVLVTELCNMINALILNTECDEMKTNLDLSDNFYKLAADRGLFTESVREKLLKQKAEKRLPVNNKCMLPREFASTCETGARIRTVRFGEEATKRLLSESRSRKQKLTGVISAAFFQSLKQLCHENSLEFGPRASVCVPINLRFRLDCELLIWKF